MQASDVTPLDTEHEAVHASLEVSEIEGCGKGLVTRLSNQQSLNYGTEAAL